jgi:hypothetical protein
VTPEQAERLDAAEAEAARARRDVAFLARLLSRLSPGCWDHSNRPSAQEQARVDALADPDGA